MVELLLLRTHLGLAREKRFAHTTGSKNGPPHILLEPLIWGEDWAME
jgi:hypothetical protein